MLSEHSAGMVTASTFLVYVDAVTRESESVQTYVLRLPSGDPMPAFHPGAHIDIHLDNGLVRSYSLINSTGEQDRYVIAVDEALQSRGGSRWISEQVTAGDVLRISQPKNLFPLQESAPHSVLIAGGIGITPLLSMARYLEEKCGSWELHYCARNQERAVFQQELLTAKRWGTVSLHFSEVQGHRDLRAIVSAAPDRAHFYCCGPSSMLDAFLSATENIEQERVHIERFSGAESVRDGAFDLILAKSRRVLRVMPGETALERLMREGFEIPNSCGEGVCGSCEVRLLAGKADHRDMILTDDEKADNTSVFVCCSGSLTPSLTLDL
ncbi:PDR/VanB family oxidoreductase [Haliea sp. E1-2-M8]|uniref:PDR/VanB family oxidoreductase n=1 Tax=Haliea sp. E1-2-M8 TaxID=3064706 RepID=UPI00271BA34D|nr:PDR/VanB family oxidoreductase [Haliea sp. E1-2-M8]MDO8864223.1 PDR/VanB family oxidoreductase [Haliea sp. E1-2-M8]